MSGSTTTGAGTPRYWQAGAVLNSAVLEPLQELNQAWLAALAQAPRYWSVPPPHARLPDPICARIVSMPVERRTEVARCPFSLFTARFNDSGYWAVLAENVASVSTVHESTHGRESDGTFTPLVEFSQLALFYAWYLSRVNPSAARVVLGMTDKTIAIFAELKLVHLPVIAERQDLFAPRWPERDGFWLRLLSAESDVEQATDVRLLGLQMLAAELAGIPAAQPARRR